MKRSGFERLESRVSPVGFIEGPAPIPIRLHLEGTVTGVATERAVPRLGGTDVHLAASGRLSTVGRTSVSGSLLLSGGRESGTLQVRAPSAMLVLRVVGESPEPGKSAELRFNIVDGKGPPPRNTTFQYTVETGNGALVISFGSGTPRAPVSLEFRAH